MFYSYDNINNGLILKIIGYIPYSS